MEKEETKSIYDNFTRQFSLQKTLRFELKPIWNTPNILDFRNDQIRYEKYNTIKPWFDRLHSEFIEDSLRNFKFADLTSYQLALSALQKDRKSKKAKELLANEETKLREEITKKFEGTANIWAASERYKFLGLKKSGVDILFEAGVFKLMKERFKDEKDTVINGNNIFDDWDKWTGYFKKFFETRKNFYKSDDTSTAIAYRIVNQNLRRFRENIDVFDKIKEKIDIGQINKNFNVDCNGVFSLVFYSKCLLQNGIDNYNKIIGGEVGDGAEKIQGMNELINKYRQDNPKEKMPFLKLLDKQIHSDKDLFIEIIQDDHELLERLAIFHDNAATKVNLLKKLLGNFIANCASYDLDKIYLSKESLAHNAGRWFSDYSSFERSLFTVVSQKGVKNDYELLRTHKTDSKISDKEGKISLPDFIKCSHISEALNSQEGSIWKEKYREQLADFDKIKNRFEQFVRVLNYEFVQQLSRDVTDNAGKQNQEGYEIYDKEIADLISAKPEAIGRNAKISIKNFADSMLSIYQFGKYFAVEKRRAWLDNYELDDTFYKASDVGYLNFYRNAFEQIIRPYNLFRNYLTKKPFNNDKWPLYFGNPTLADGWDKNKEPENSAVIFENEGSYLLGIMKKNCNGLFVEGDKYNQEKIKYRKMNYKYFPDPSRMIPKCTTQLKAVKKHFANSEDDFILFDKVNFVKPLKITKRIFELNNFEYKKLYLQTLNGSNPAESSRVVADSKKTNQVKIFQKDFLDLSHNKKAYKSALTDWIDFCKEFLSAYKSTATSDFDYSHFKQAESYNSIDEFYRDVEVGSYKLSWQPYSERYLKEKNGSNDLFLFKIHNKDWNLRNGKKKTGSKNLHTLYFEQLFSKENERENFVYKLNGEAELFFRKATAASKLGYKEKNGKRMRNKKGEEVLNGFRYSKDKIFFHCPITVNRVSAAANKNDIDGGIKKLIAGREEINFIGIDRGEKNLAYYSIIDRQGKIIKTESLNEIGKDGFGNPIKYAVKLDARMKEREVSRREWKEVERIADLKKGYISQVVRKLSNLAIENNAVIILEDLSMRFKQIRGGIEKSIYQQLEKALIDKLGYFADKKEDNSNKAGHLLNAYQLAYPITSSREMGKQTGAIFYTQAGYTSKTCPACGYRRNIKCGFESIEKARDFFGKLDDFFYDKKCDAFHIKYSLDKLYHDRQQKEQKTNELYTDLTKKNTFMISTKNAFRYKWFDRYSQRAKLEKFGISSYENNGVRKESDTKKGVVKVFDLTEYLKGVLKTGVDSGGLKEFILSTARDKNFYQDLLYAMYLLTETRQSISGTDIDYIHCAACGFDSRAGFQGIKNFSADANGAYNIARKGIIIKDKIKQFSKKEDLTKMGWGDLVVSINEWDKFAQSQYKEN